VILVTWEAKIGRIVVQGQPRQIVHETLISKITREKNGLEEGLKWKNACFVSMRPTKK
jgi:hypothetical protein